MTLQKLINTNFDLRRQIFGDAGLLVCCCCIFCFFFHIKFILTCSFIIKLDRDLLFLVVGARNIKMIETARRLANKSILLSALNFCSVGASAKFSGSGGACVVMCLDGDKQEAALNEAAKRGGEHK